MSWKNYRVRPSDIEAVQKSDPGIKPHEIPWDVPADIDDGDEALERVSFARPLVVDGEAVDLNKKVGSPEQEGRVLVSTPDPHDRFLVTEPPTSIPPDATPEEIDELRFPVVPRPGTPEYEAWLRSIDQPKE